jgi:hypothetical protein
MTLAQLYKNISTYLCKHRNKCSYLLRFPHWVMQDVSHGMISFDGQMPQ